MHLKADIRCNINTYGCGYYYRFFFLHHHQCTICALYNSSIASLNSNVALLMWLFQCLMQYQQEGLGRRRKKTQLHDFGSDELREKKRTAYDTKDAITTKETIILSMLIQIDFTGLSLSVFLFWYIAVFSLPLVTIHAINVSNEKLKCCVQCMVQCFFIFVINFRFNGMFFGHHLKLTSMIYAIAKYLKLKTLIWLTEYVCTSFNFVFFFLDIVLCHNECDIQHHW